MGSPRRRTGSAKAQGHVAPRGHENTSRAQHGCGLGALRAALLLWLLRASMAQELHAHTEEQEPSGKGCPPSYSWGALKLMEGKALEEA